ncbi:MAG TPA: hypothetical protein GXZ77_01855 [Papillibacter sp.]|nr:hypothetical protein [Papillibacter sp.]
MRGHEKGRKGSGGITAESVWKEYEKGLAFKAQIGLFDTVRVNENFFIGKQWEGVASNGLPTPVFNFLKRLVLFTVSSITSNSVKLQASLIREKGAPAKVRALVDAVNAEFERLFERNDILALTREMMRNTAVDGDGCLYTYWDTELETGGMTRGGIVTEVIENTRVFFGNVNDRRVEKQPYIILSRREMADALRERARLYGCEGWETIRSDTDDNGSDTARMVDDKATVLIRFWRNRETRTIWACETAKGVLLRAPWDTGLRRYPITWINWDYVTDCYHGQAMLTGLIPNQIFINKLYAMSMISLMTTAYPKVVYDRTRIAKWDNRVGAAIPVAGGDMSSVARIIDPAQISPQIAQFIQMAVRETQANHGATSVALGEARPENTSAITALQKASAVPSELTRHNLYRCLEDLGRIYLDFMGEYYGVHIPDGGTIDEAVDFSMLGNVGVSLRLDVGASSYWSEIAAVQTLDNLMAAGKIDMADYLERLPEGYIARKQELLDKVQARTEMGAEAPAQKAARPDTKDALIALGQFALS